METHVKVLGALHIAFGVLGILAAFVVFVVFGGIAGIVSTAAEGDGRMIAPPIIAMVGMLVIAIILISSIPALIAGFGLLGYRNWARILTLVLSALDLFNIPLGTMLGAYGFWVLLSKETEYLFQNPPRRQAYA